MTDKDPRVLLCAIEWAARLRAQANPLSDSEKMALALADELRDHQWWERTAGELQKQRDDMKQRLDRINMTACYASEEDTSAQPEALLQIGKLARGEEVPGWPR